jgi:hypothetical protein
MKFVAAFLAASSFAGNYCSWKMKMNPREEMTNKLPALFSLKTVE